MKYTVWGVLYQEPVFVVGDTRWPRGKGVRLASVHGSKNAAEKHAATLKPPRYTGIRVVTLSITEQDTGPELVR